MRGFVGAYPNALFVVPHGALDDFVTQIEQLDGGEAYAALRARYGVRRTNPRFWTYSDRFQRAHAELDPLKVGLLDYNRLDGQ